MNRAIRCLAVIFVALGVLSLALDALGRMAPERPDPTIQAAVDALVTDNATAASAAIPATFRQDEGYTPARVGGLLLRPTGDCSGPDVLPADFAPVCKRHDLGYDLLRVAERHEGRLPGSARRAVDAQLDRGLAELCATRPTVAGRLDCRVWAAVAALGVGLNSARQHWSTPGRESSRSWASLGAAVTSVLCGAALLALLTRRAAAWTRPSSSAVGAQVLRRANLGWLVRAGAVLAGLFPSHLPHPAPVQAVTVLAFLAVAEPLARRLARRRVRRRVRGQAAIAAGLGLGAAGAVAWEIGQQNGIRRSAGMLPTEPRHWFVVAALVGLGVLLPRALRSVGRTAARRWRPIVAVVAAGSVLTAAAPAQAAPTASRAASVSDDVLLTPSPVGAVRSYAAIRPGEDLTARAERAADSLVAAGGLTRHHVVLMLPTGSGWVDPAAVSGLEDRFGADVAEVGIQSTSVPSWVAFLAQRGAAAAGARALYAAVEDRIAALPVGTRPQLHVWGESLGATSGQAIFSAPAAGHDARTAVCSVLWVGSPGGHRSGLTHETLVSNPTDPVVHTSLRSVVVPPGDGRPWLPVVSLVQSGVDFVSSRSGPVGTGHVYGPDQVAALQTC